MDPETDFPDDQSDGSEEFDIGDTIEFDDSAPDFYHSSTVGHPPFPFTNDGISLVTENGVVLPPSANPINWTNYNFAQLNQNTSVANAAAASKAHAMMMSDHESANGGVSSSAVNAATPSANPSGSMISTAATIAQEPAAKHKAPLYNPYVSGGGWDPVGSADWDARKPSDFCLGRIARDLHSLYTDPIAGVMVHAYESNVTKMMALIAGPEKTPYDGGHFLFFLRFPPDYPIHSPRVRILTTGGGTVRFNPNLYANGKVCLSLLGTWAGPAWSPVLNTSSLLLSIQSLLGENPYQNEPGYDKVAPSHPSVVSYNDHIRYETIRIAVIDIVEKALQPSSVAPKTTKAPGKRNLDAAGDNIDLNVFPERFCKLLLTAFIRNYDKHVAVVESYQDKDQQQVKTFLHDTNYKCCWKDLASKLPELKARVETEVASWSEEKVGEDGIGDCVEEDKISSD